MTIYVHFKSATPPVKLFNVDAVKHVGVDSIRVCMMFSDEQRTFTNVRNVAIQPEQAD